MNSGFLIRPLNAAGHVTARPMPSQVRPDYSFVYLISGEVLTDICGKPYLLHGRDCALIPPSLEIDIRYFRDSIGYMGAFGEDFLKNSGHPVLRLAGPSVLTVPEDDRVFFDELMIRLSRSADNLMMARSLVDVLLCQFDMVLPEPQGSAASRLCSAFLGKVFDASFPFRMVSGYAESLGVTPNHLNRAVKAETGRSAGAWIDNARLALARTLLCDRSVPMAEISDRLGFSEPSYFSRFFHKMTGLTPSAFRSMSGQNGMNSPA